MPKVLLLIDPQERMMASIEASDRVLDRMRFLAECAPFLSISVISTRQNPEKLGGLCHGLTGDQTFDKKTFSAFPAISAALPLEAEIAVAGVETHICVYQTVRDLRANGYSVTVASDAVGSRTTDRHETGLAAIRDLGASIMHSEAVVYEWLQSADHPRFRDILGLVKSHAL